MNIPSNWYEDFFYGVSLDLWRKAISPQQTKAESDFLVKALGCNEGSHLLDVPCGNGRLSLELAGCGYRVTGVDIAAEFIEEARARSSALNSMQEELPATPGDSDEVARAFGAWITGGPRVPQFILSDMRQIEGEAIYDGAYCFGNSFGFLAYADMESFLSGVSRALKPGARFVIETGMAAESVLHKFEAESSHQIADILVTIKEQYLAEESCIDTEYIFEQNGKVESRKAKHWIYTAGEIRRMLERAGFTVLNLYGSLECGPYTLGADELYVIARRV
jgi:ubiquinone/menaquinone biosynthesis C-methylase UbiE